MVEPLTLEDESRLLSLAQTGSKRAFGKLVEHYRPSLVEYAQQILGDHDAAEDAVQNGLLYAWRNIGNFEDRGGKFKFWLRAVVKNHNRDVQKASARDKSTTFAVDSEFGPQPIWTSVCYNPDIFDPETVGSEERVKCINQAIASLPRTQRMVFELYMDGLRLKYIAQSLGITYLAAKQNLSRAKKKLRLIVSEMDTLTPV